MSFMAEGVYESLVGYLTLDRAKALVPEQFVPCYQWFIDWMDKPIRTLPHHFPISERPNTPIPLSCDSGIYIPSVSRVNYVNDRRYALSIASTGRFGDRPLITQPDGTWLLDYSQQVGAAPERRFNESLMNCLYDGIPVGVYLKQAKGGYTVLGLAYVERFNAFTGMFTLHGPVLPETEAKGCFMSRGFDELPAQQKKEIEALDLSTDERKVTLTRQVRREQQGKFRQLLLDAYDMTCAVTKTDVPQVLQAAHINPYRGRNSQIVTNGILLRADLHLLFDAYLMSIDPETHRVVLSEKLANSKYESLAGIQMSMPSRSQDAPNVDLLGLHLEQFLTENKRKAIGLPRLVSMPG